MQNTWIYFLIILLGIIFLFPINKKCQDDRDNIIRTLARQSARWITAAKQDKNPMIKVLHANYGAGYWWALRDVATSEDFNRATGLDLLKFEKEITAVQDAATQEMAGKCPEWAPKKSYLTKIAGEGA